MQPRHLMFSALAAALACNAATAAEIERTELTMAVSACQSALPVFDGVVRKRPLAVQNEGDSSTFITCGLEGVFGALPHSTYIGISLQNNGSAPATASCTLVDAGSGFASPTYLPVSRTISPGTSSEVTWIPEDAAFIYPAISCNVPPGVGIKYLARRFREEIGS